MATDEYGYVAWQAANSAFDRLVTIDHINGLAIGYPGQYYDDETQTWNNGPREYDALTGRFLQSDPLGLVDGPNTCLYAGGNPNAYVDPSGLAAHSYLNRPLGMSVETFQNAERDGAEKGLHWSAEFLTVISPVGWAALGD
ncbi:RHS repeat-associated core domain-containing protein [Paraferrimonas haliotis]|uniref:RHS repeat-associated core domain-containing protein n=1 Tax=Paraferrimonas haliotis TaxID=2013866 RepID=A0AA37WVA4_9GAMM|nr:RHS repeat-associated core domain-containing protein [Paraferrimonas haliotis]GLS82128.1 hypothetical protein GCM10007894_01050 [Paraferrimonas haliotis]